MLYAKLNLHSRIGQNVSTKISVTIKFFQKKKKIRKVDFIDIQPF